MTLEQDIACAAANPNAGLVPATGVCHGRRAAPGPNFCRGYAVASCRPGAGSGMAGAGLPAVNSAPAAV